METERLNYKDKVVDRLKIVVGSRVNGKRQSEVDKNNSSSFSWPPPGQDV